MKNANEKSFILLYHGVTDSESVGIENFSKKHISAKEFEKQIRFISENMNAVSLRNIKDKPNSVAVTFDDTFKNIHDVALPILKKYNVPATFFITTGFIGNSRNFWVDTLEHAVNFTDKNTLVFNGSSFLTDSKENKIKCVTEVKKYLKSVEPENRNSGLEEIKAQLGFKDDILVNNYSNLSKQEVKNLDQPPMYEVGGHTVNHEILSYLCDDDLQFEISNCIQTLESILGRKVDLFSYPEGQKNHYDDRVINCLKDNGITICPSAIDGFLGDEDEFNYRRIMVGFMGREFPVCIE